MANKLVEESQDDFTCLNLHDLIIEGPSQSINLSTLNELTWEQYDFQRSYLIHPEMIAWRKRYFARQGVALPEAVCSNLAKYEYQIHLSVYPSYTEIKTTKPEFGGLLMGQVSRLKQIEASFMYLGLFLEQKPDLAEVTTKYMKILAAKISQVAGFIGFFYDRIAFQVRQYDLRGKGFCVQCFSCFLAAGELESSLRVLQNTHLHRLDPKEVLRDLDELHKSYLDWLSENTAMARAAGYGTSDMVTPLSEVSGQRVRFDDTVHLLEGEC